MLHIALEIPLGLLLVGGGTQGHHPAAAGIERFGDALDRAALTGGVAPLEDHDQTEAGALDPVLHLHQLQLELGQFRFVEAAVELLAGRARHSRGGLTLARASGMLPATTGRSLMMPIGGLAQVR